ncbi:hypothetical protein [Amycolatopsis samaneae]|uniref:Uncharacterized protein n=1 Tax=Amycolatopsis samaneae TaxID=664691 RepID=A0ABW5GKE0_9PSEU
MTLEAQLYRGELGQWCRANLPGTGTVIADVRRNLAAAGHPDPLRPAAPVAAEHWQLAADAFRQRCTYLVDGAVPATALLGAVRAGLVRRGWAEQTCTGHNDGDRWSPWRPGSPGWFGAARVDGADTATKHEPVLTDLLTRTQIYLVDHAPPGTIGTPGAEAGLARSCWLAAAWENAADGLPAELAAVHEQPGYRTEDLRRVVPDAALADLVTMTGLLRSSGTLAYWRGERLGFETHNPRPLGTSRPVIVPHWATGDLLIGHRLTLVKAPLQVDDDLVARWLWQLLACIWLDTNNRLDIGPADLYLARHGVLTGWGSTVFADSLLGGSGRAERGGREDFLRLARRVIAAAGAQPPGEWSHEKPTTAMPVDWSSHTWQPASGSR